MADSDSMGGKVGIRELGCRSQISRGMMAVITMITPNCHELAFFMFFSPYFSQYLRSLSVQILSYQSYHTPFIPFRLLTLFTDKEKHVY